MAVKKKASKLNPELTCVCGKIAKSKSGLFAHQRFCKEYKEGQKAPELPSVATELKVKPATEIETPVMTAASEPEPIVPVVAMAEAPAAPLFGIKVASTAASAWQYYRWVWMIARNMRITNPTGSELAAVKTFLKAFWNPQTQTGTRNWLETPFNKKSMTASASNYQGDIDSEPTPVLVEMIGVVGRDLNKIPVQTAEKAIIDTLISATGNRRYGTGEEFGGVGGSLVSIP